MLLTYSTLHQIQAPCNFDLQSDVPDYKVVKLFQNTMKRVCVCCARACFAGFVLLLVCNNAPKGWTQRPKCSSKLLGTHVQLQLCGGGSASNVESGLFF